MRYMLVLTDGDNTENRWSRNSRDINRRTAKACQNAKDAGIIVLTVRLMEGSAELLKDCASAPELYTDVQNASDLTATFGEFAKMISELRIGR